MTSIKSLIPALYLHGTNELSPFLDALQPEIDYLEHRIALTQNLPDIDRCPDEYLGYLASLTGAPLIGEISKYHRRSIRSWPEVLKTKGTEHGMKAFLEAVGFGGIELPTYFRDSSGRLVTAPPDGEPFYDSIAQEWRNIRTHYFSIKAKAGADNPFGTVVTAEKLGQLKAWVEAVKPFHAELLGVYVDIKPPGYHTSCYYNSCHYSHGYYPKPSVNSYLCGPLETDVLLWEHRVRVVLSKMVWGLSYDYSKYGQKPTDRRTRRAVCLYFSKHSDFLVPDQPHARNRSLMFSQGTYDMGEPMGSVNCVYSPRIRVLGSVGKYGTAKYNGNVVTPHYERVRCYYVVKHRLDVDMTSVSSSCEMACVTIIRTSSVNTFKPRRQVYGGEKYGARSPASIGQVLSVMCTNNTAGVLANVITYRRGWVGPVDHSRWKTPGEGTWWQKSSVHTVERVVFETAKYGGTRYGDRPKYRIVTEGE